MIAGKSLCAALALALLFGGAAPAHALFYRLTGRYACLEKPDAVCYDATIIPQGHAGVSTPGRSAAAASPGAAARDDGVPVVLTPMQALVLRLKAGKPTAADLALLRSRAHAGNGDALELLGWCAIRGLGMPRDPVAAYFFYSAAATAKVPQAWHNKVLIYEHDLTNEQQQHVLEVEDNDLPRSSAAAPD